MCVSHFNVKRVGRKLILLIIMLRESLFCGVGYMIIHIIVMLPLFLFLRYAATPWVNIALVMDTFHCSRRFAIR